MVAIIVNYFTEHYLSPLIQRLGAEPGIRYIVIVDNGSLISPESIYRNSSKVKIIKAEGNLGYGAAVNLAVKRFPSDWYLVLNPDLLPKKGFSQALYETAIQTGALITGPRFFLDEEESWRLPPATGYSLSQHLRLECAVRKQADADMLSSEWAMQHHRFWTSEQPFHEFFLSGACMLIRFDRDFFRDGKIFDERFFLYFEDADLCLRASQAGLMPVCVPRAKVVHYWNQSPSAGKGLFFEESRDKFLGKHYNGISLPNLTFRTEPRNEGTNMGKWESSPLFEAGKPESGLSYYFETGINWFFLPFIQADFAHPSFRIPDRIWNLIPSGVYYSRIRNNLGNTLTMWKWEKV